MTGRRLAVLAAAGLGVGAVIGIADARPGGGDSYSGGGGHGGGGGGDGGDGGGGGVFLELLYWLFRLILVYPSIGLPILAVVIGYLVFNAYRQRKNKDWDSGPPVALAQAIALTDVRQLDPTFSQIVFEDFAFRLFSAAHVTETARAALAARPPVGEPVVQVVVGALRTYRVEVPEGPVDPQGRPRRVHVGIEYEANIATAERTYFCVERWLFGRDASAHSKPPGAARTFPCPNCGAPWQAAQSGTQVCASCGEAVDNGRFDWVVEQIATSACDERPPTLTSEVAERGTQLPTYRQPELAAAWRRLTRDDPQLTDDTLLARLAMIYAQLNAAWTNGDLRPIRGLVSDGLYDYLHYWLEAYRRQGLRNVLTDMRITRTAIARIRRDRYFDAIAIRIWGTGRDYVIRVPGGEHVRGSKHRERAYSEYWTLIRSAQRKGAPATAPACGNCGAPLQITQSGECEHCGAHVTGGEFDWILSKVEQDDSYRG